MMIKSSSWWCDGGRRRRMSSLHVCFSSSLSWLIQSELYNSMKWCKCATCDDDEDGALYFNDANVLLDMMKKMELYNSMMQICYLRWWWRWWWRWSYGHGHAVDGHTVMVICWWSYGHGPMAMVIQSWSYVEGHGHMVMVVVIHASNDWCYLHDVCLICSNRTIPAVIISVGSYSVNENRWKEKEACFTRVETFLVGTDTKQHNYHGVCFDSIQFF